MGGHLERAVPEIQPYFAVIRPHENKTGKRGLDVAEHLRNIERTGNNIGASVFSPTYPQPTHRFADID